MCKIFYVFGTTCSGKTWFLEKAQELYPHLFGVVEVGKELRRRYPPEYFEGLGAPKKTEQEAIDIFNEQLEDAKSKGMKYVLVSGQPRRESQIEPTIIKHGGVILFLFAPDEILMERINQREEGAKQLALSRLKNDRIQLFDVLFHLLDNECEIRTIDTTKVDVLSVIHQIAHYGDT